MSVQVTGRYVRTTSREVKPVPGGKQFEPFTEVQAVVQDWGQTFYVTYGRDFDQASMPEPGTDVIFEVIPKGSGARVYYTGISVRAVEQAAKGSRVAAVS